MCVDGYSAAVISLTSRVDLTSAEPAQPGLHRGGLKYPGARLKVQWHLENQERIHALFNSQYVLIMVSRCNLGRWLQMGAKILTAPL